MSNDVAGREHLVARQVALTSVFKRFSRIWPKAFHANTWEGLLEPWMDQLRGVDTDRLDAAAREYLRTAAPTYAPKPWEFAKFARQHQRDAGTSAPAVHADRERGPLDGARAFWFERTQYDGTIARATGHALRTGGSVGIAETEMDKLLAGEIRWGWL